MKAYYRMFLSFFYARKEKYRNKILYPETEKRKENIVMEFVNKEQMEKLRDKMKQLSLDYASTAEHLNSSLNILNRIIKELNAAIRKGNSIPAVKYDILMVLLDMFFQDTHENGVCGNVIEIAEILDAIIQLEV